MQKTILFFFLILFALSGDAQEITPIQTDRPDQTETPFITPRRQVQMEIGFVYEKENKQTTNFTYPNILTKLGLSKRVELRLVTEYGGTQKEVADVATTTNAVNPTLIGCKVNFFEEKKILPQTSMIMHFGVPFLAGKAFRKQQNFITFRFLMQHTLNEKFSLSYNLGAEWDGIKPDATGIYTLSLGYSASPRIGSYIELYGFHHGTHFMHQYDMGLTYLLNRNLQLDISGGLGLSPSAPDYFVGCGISFRTGHDR